MIAARARTRRTARPRRCPRTRGRPRASGRVGHGVRRRRRAARRARPASAPRARADRTADRGFERARQAIELAGGRIAEAAIEQRRGDPDRRASGRTVAARKAAIRRLRSRFIASTDRASSHDSRNGPASIACVTLGLAAPAQRVDQRLQREARRRRVRRRRRSRRGTRVESRTAGRGRAGRARSPGRSAARGTRPRRRRRQVRRPIGRASTARDGESFFPEIVAQGRTSAGSCAAGDCPARAAPRSRSTRTDRPSFRRASGSPFDEAESGRADVQRVADRVDGQPTAPTSARRGHASSGEQHRAAASREPVATTGSRAPGEPNAHREHGASGRRC